MRPITRIAEITEDTLDLFVINFLIFNKRQSQWQGRLRGFRDLPDVTEYFVVDKTKVGRVHFVARSSDFF